MSNNSKPPSSAPEATTRPPYAQYQIELYARALLSDTPEEWSPPTTTDPTKLESQARAVMDPAGFGYVVGGAGEGATMRNNRAAFGRWAVVPRMMRRTAPRDVRVEIFGRNYDSPLVMAPVGVQKAYHADGEVGTASACATLGVPFVYSTASSTGLEEVAAAADKVFASETDGEGKAPRWFQLYRPRDNRITRSLLDRAKKVGCEVLVVTLDTFTLSWRPEDLDRGFLPFLKGTGCQLGFGDPVFRRMWKEESGEEIEDNVMGAARAWIGEVFSGDGHGWEDLKELREMWGPGPIVLKGICCVADAVRAREAGMDGVVVSNHGGRQLDGAVASLDVLPEIVYAVGKEMTVLFDSGVRTGADVMKALALGARAVLVGRPVIYGLGIKGEEGARHVLAGLLADLDQSMGLAGVKSVGELNRGMLRGVEKSSL